MRIDILTLFPDMCNAVLNGSIIGRARKAGKVEINCIDIRDYTLDKHRRVDDVMNDISVGRCCINHHDELPLKFKI